VKKNCPTFPLAFRGQVWYGVPPPPNTMKPTSEQSQAIAKAKKWYDACLPGQSSVFRLFGPAGTGKTAIAKFIAEKVPGKVLFACFTGKAAHVLRTKGCDSAGTIHGLIYLPKSQSAQRLRDLQAEYVLQADAEASQRVLDALQEQIVQEQTNLRRPMFAVNSQSQLRDASLLIVDEVSMVDHVMAQDLLSFGVPILVLGDPDQLPPVKGTGYFINHEPDVLLKKIHRQAEGSPVLKLATEVRQGMGLSNAGDLVKPKGQSTEFLASFDQILCGTNRTRRIVNRKMREHLGFEGLLPQVSDRMICTRNDGDTGLLNGSQWIVRDVYSDPDTDYLAMTISSVDEEHIVLTVDVHPQPFRDEEIPFWSMRDAQCFDYAYAMTVHKSQGSQFNSVCLIDESGRFPAHQRRAWMYTGITRAAKEVSIIK
jgi:exodeoxyribonuclease-5